MSTKLKFTILKVSNGTYQAGTILYENGDVKLPDGTVIHPPGWVRGNAKP